MWADSFTARAGGMRNTASLLPSFLWSDECAESEGGGGVLRYFAKTTDAQNPCDTLVWPKPDIVYNAPESSLFRLEWDIGGLNNVKNSFFMSPAFRTSSHLNSMWIGVSVSNDLLSVCVTSASGAKCTLSISIGSSFSSDRITHDFANLPWTEAVTAEHRGGSSLRVIVDIVEDETSSESSLPGTTRTTTPTACDEEAVAETATAKATMAIPLYQYLGQTLLLLAESSEPRVGQQVIALISRILTQDAQPMPSYFFDGLAYAANRSSSSETLQNIVNESCKPFLDSKERILLKKLLD